MKLGGLFKRKSKRPEAEDEPTAGYDDGRAVRTGPRGEASEAEAFQEAMAHAIPDGLEIDMKVNTIDNEFFYMVKVSNKTEDMLGDVNIAITPDKPVVTCPEPRNSVKFIDPGKNKVFKFLLKPTMKCGKTTIQGLIRYFDFNEKVKQEYLLPEYDLSISCPDIIGKEVDEETWRITMSRLKIYELETEELDFEPQKVFVHFSKIVTNMGFYSLKSAIIPSLYRGVGKFFGVDALMEPLCIEVQVVGSGKKSRLLFRVWATDSTSAMGIAFRCLSKVNKRLDITSKLVLPKGK